MRLSKNICNQYTSYIISRISVLAILLASLNQAAAQSLSEKAMSITADTAYISGVGFGSTVAEADKNALNDLSSKIRISVNSRSDMNMSAGSMNGDTEYKSDFTSATTTKSFASLTNTKSLIVSDAPNVQVLRYISVAEFNKAQSFLKDKIDNYVRDALRAENRGKIDNALRFFYWAYVLTNSLQYPEAAIYNDKGQERRLITWLPQQIEEIMDNLSANIVEVGQNEATLYFTYKDRPVGSLDFMFYNGVGYTVPIGVKDGMASVSLRPGVDAKTLKIKYEYAYPGQAAMDIDVAAALSMGWGTASFDKAQKALYGASSTVSADTEKCEEMYAIASKNVDIGVAQIDDLDAYHRIIEEVISAVTHKDYTRLRPLFTDEGWDMMTKLLKYGQAKMLGRQEYGFYPSPTGGVTCRSLVMTFSFPNNKRVFTEDVVFDFNESKKIDCIAFGLGADAKAAVFDKTVWPDDVKMSIVDFLENYKTAFALKRLDFIESIFDDNAVIITGHVAKRKVTKTDGIVSGLNPEIIEYTRYNKKGYIEKLRKIFNNNEFVNIRFTDNDIVKMKGDIFGIQIHQDYYSSSYADTGYLFLLVDMTDKSQPTIQFRSWQPDRDPDMIQGNLPKTHRDYGIIGPGLF